MRITRTVGTILAAVGMCILAALVWRSVKGFYSEEVRTLSPRVTETGESETVHVTEPVSQTSKVLEDEDSEPEAEETELADPVSVMIARLREEHQGTSFLRVP